MSRMGEREAKGAKSYGSAALNIEQRSIAFINESLQCRATRARVRAPSSLHESNLRTSTRKRWPRARRDRLCIKLFNISKIMHQVGEIKKKSE